MRKEWKFSLMTQLCLGLQSAYFISPLPDVLLSSANHLVQRNLWQNANFKSLKNETQACIHHPFLRYDSYQIKVFSFHFKTFYLTN